VLHKNAQIVVRGNALVFTCGQLKKLAVGEKEYDIGILPTPHGFGLRRGEFNGAGGARGLEGANGSPGVMPLPGYNFLGKVLPDGVSQRDMNGSGGENGGDGEDGQAGLTGGACRIAEINIRSFLNDIPLTIGAIAGNGGNGGDGGDGGHGGAGGDGAAAIKTFDGKWVGGFAGAGGNGGNGGSGGRAGHSGMSSHVFIDIPFSALDNLYFFSKPGKPGVAGKGGKAGLGGAAGRSDLKEAVEGFTGREGLTGKPGRILPAAKVYVNNEPFCVEIPINYYGDKLPEKKDFQNVQS